MFKIWGWPDRVQYISKIALSFSSFLYPSHRPYGSLLPPAWLSAPAPSGSSSCQPPALLLPPDDQAWQTGSQHCTSSEHSTALYNCWNLDEPSHCEAHRLWKPDKCVFAARLKLSNGYSQLQLRSFGWTEISFWIRKLEVCFDAAVRHTFVSNGMDWVKVFQLQWRIFIVWFGMVCFSVNAHGWSWSYCSDLDRVITAKNGTTQSSMKYKSLKVHH